MTADPTPETPASMAIAAWNRRAADKRIAELEAAGQRPIVNVVDAAEAKAHAAWLHCRAAACRGTADNATADRFDRIAGVLLAGKGGESATDHIDQATAREQWIACAEALPEDNTQCLVAWPCGQMAVGHYDSRVQSPFRDRGWLIPLPLPTERFTHWRLLPDAPARKAGGQ